MNIAKLVAASVLSAVGISAQATPLTYTVDAPAFTYISGSFAPGAHITGYLRFDSSLLDAQGTGGVGSDPRYFNAGLAWSFTDGINTFDNVNTTWAYTIGMGFEHFVPVSWNIDTTWGVTGWSDIFLNSSGRNESYYMWDFAAGDNATAANWTVSGLAEVPEPGSLALLGLGFAGIAALRRNKKA